MYPSCLGAEKYGWSFCSWNYSSGLSFSCYYVIQLVIIFLLLYFQTDVFSLEKLMTLCSWMYDHRRTWNFGWCQLHQLPNQKCSPPQQMDRPVKRLMSIRVRESFWGTTSASTMPSDGVCICKNCCFEENLDFAYTRYRKF